MNTRKLVLPTALVVALLLAAYFGFRHYQDKDAIARYTIAEREASLRQDSLLGIRAALNKELALIKEELNIHKGKNAQLDASLARANAEVERRQVIIHKLEKDRSGLAALRRQLAELKQFRISCASELEAIVRRNKELEGRIESLAVDNNDLKKRYKDLADKLEPAKQLFARITAIHGYRLRKNGSAVQVSRMKKAERFSVEVEIAENTLADAGERKVYLVITDPDGNVLGKPSQTFSKADGEKSQMFSSVQKLNYQNTQTKMRFSYDLDGKAGKGTYKFEIFIDGRYGARSELAYVVVPEDTTADNDNLQ